ncbi:hypothetical protein HRR79_000239 [Exophiala dermatitidis]|nr:hypothetical protein HRR79_000239 [Exophiala dermatitidis]
MQPGDSRFRIELGVWYHWHGAAKGHDVIPDGDADRISSIMLVADIPSLGPSRCCVSRREFRRHPLIDSIQLIPTVRYGWNIRWSSLDLKLTEVSFKPTRGRRESRTLVPE